MSRRTRKEISSWEEFTYRGRTFARAVIPRGLNEDQPYTAARRIGERYEVKRFFASGGCGLLLLGRDARTDAEVLLKTTLRYETAHDVAARDREGFTRKLLARRQQLQTERRLLVLLRNQGCNGVPHPNDYVFDWNPSLAGPHLSDDGQPWLYDDEALLATEPYLVLEAVAGDTLEDVLEEQAPAGLDEGRALGVLVQVLDVLRRLHRTAGPAGGGRWDVVYQDLKPGNILLGPHDRATLIDLGGCRLSVDGRLALRGAHTPGYCPEECCRADVPVTAAADAYAAGSTLYHLLTGRPPADFLPRVPRGPEDHAVHPDRWDWALLEGKASPGACRLVRRCLHPVPGQRPTDDELAAEVRRLLE
jgi:serine/threonine protein kinase